MTDCLFFTMSMHIPLSKFDILFGVIGTRDDINVCIMVRKMVLYRCHVAGHKPGFVEYLHELKSNVSLLNYLPPQTSVAANFSNK